MKVAMPCTISKVMTLADNTVRIQVDAQEAPAEQMADLFAMKGGLGWFLYSENSIKHEDVKDLPEIKPEFGEKTPAARLRGVLYVMWEQTKSSLTFEQFYRERMEQLITLIKEKLN